MHLYRSCVLIACLQSLSIALAADRPDVLFADFEGQTWDDWSADGKAFGNGPAEGTLAGQMAVSGFQGKRLVNSFNGGDGPTGTLTSPEFRIQRRYVRFLIGGGGYEGKTCINLLVNGQVARSATGPNLRAGGSEALEQAAWEVTDLEGKTARIQIVDQASGGWGHINIDHIVFSDARPQGSLPLQNPSRSILANAKLLRLPVKNGAKVRTAKVTADGTVVREFTIEAADDQPDWWASLDVSAWAGKPLTVEVDKLPESSQFLSMIDAAEKPRGRDGIYGEPSRPQFHFSPARGWLNDPNGLAFYNGEYHLFFQHNPYGREWGNMHWGHAVSADLVRWRELPIALYPDQFGPMFSGSAVVDWANTSGLGSNGKPPLVLVYTAAGASVQCIASSIDGRTFTKYEKNPVVGKIAEGARDPKVLWHEPTKRWVMALYVGFPQPPKEGSKQPGRRDVIQFLTSPDLKSWTLTSQIDGFYECPDFFPLAVEGDPKNIKWFLTAANSDYVLGRFDGQTFVPETPKLKGHRGKGSYAAQTFSDLPSTDGRRIMIGWFQTPSNGMPFNQSMTFPLELRLLSTPQGPRLSMLPARELESLRVTSKKLGPIELKQGDDRLVSPANGDLLDVRVEFEPTPDAEVELDVLGVTIRYDAARQELAVNEHKAAAPLRHNRQRLIILADRNSFEVFASDGLTYIPFPVIPKATGRRVEISVKTGGVTVHALQLHQLRSIWTADQNE